MEAIGFLFALVASVLGIASSVVAILDWLSNREAPIEAPQKKWA